MYDERSMKYTLCDDNNKEIDLSITKEEAEGFAEFVLKDRLDSMTKKFEDLINGSNTNLEELKSLKIRFNKLLDSYIDLANKFVKAE